jgi:hypothetical protein
MQGQLIHPCFHEFLSQGSNTTEIQAPSKTKKLMSCQINNLKMPPNTYKAKPPPNISNPYQNTGKTNVRTTGSANNNNNNNNYYYYYYNNYNNNTNNNNRNNNNNNNSNNNDENNNTTETNGAEDGGSDSTPSIPQANVPPIPLSCSVPRVMTEAEIMAEDPKVQQLTAADRQLIGLYGDTIHQNSGRHLTGGIDPDLSWQHQVWFYQVIATRLSV